MKQSNGHSTVSGSCKPHGTALSEQTPDDHPEAINQLSVAAAVRNPEPGRHRASGQRPDPPYILFKNQLPMTRTSILVRAKQSKASSGRLTTGSFSLNEVLRTIGTPVSSLNAEIRAW